MRPLVTVLFLLATVGAAAAQPSVRVRVRAADVRDDGGIRRLYAAISVFGAPDRYETAAATEIERRVRAELLARK